MAIDLANSRTGGEQGVEVKASILHGVKDLRIVCICFSAGIQSLIGFRNLAVSAYQSHQKCKLQ
jgi:hypothetical protein